MVLDKDNSRTVVEPGKEGYGRRGKLQRKKEQDKERKLQGEKDSRIWIISRSIYKTKSRQGKTQR